LPLVFWPPVAARSLESGGFEASIPTPAMATLLAQGRGERGSWGGHLA